MKTDRQNGAAAQTNESNGQRIAGRVLRRARRRAAILGWSSLGLWVIAAAGFAAYVWFVLAYLWPMIAVLAEQQQSTPPDLQSRALRVLVHVTPSVTMVWALVWSGLLVLAALATVLYVMTSRRATVREIQAGLADISAQLAALDRSRGG